MRVSQQVSQIRWLEGHDLPLPPSYLAETVDTVQF